MSKLKPWLLLAVIFVVGVITGSALTIGLASHFMHPSGGQQMKQHWMMMLTRQLNLTADQQAKIQPILTDADTKIQALHRDEVDRGSQIIKAANDQISAILTPEQQAQMKKMEADREKMFSGHGGRPWGPGMRPHGGPGGKFNRGGKDDDDIKPGPSPDQKKDMPNMPPPSEH